MEFFSRKYCSLNNLLVPILRAALLGDFSEMMLFWAQSAQFGHPDDKQMTKTNKMNGSDVYIKSRCPVASESLIIN